MHQYLLSHREQLPEWLASLQPDQEISLEDFFASRVVYYPGSGFDGDPVKVFGSSHSAHCFVYVDYGVTKDQLETQLVDAATGFRGYAPTTRKSLLQTDLSPHRWRQRIHPSELSHNRIGSAEEAIAPFGFLQILERDATLDDSHGPKRLAILFLGADGIASYDVLFCQADNRPAPFVVVLQDHGGCDQFGEGGLLARLAKKCQVRPEYLLVAQNTEAWQGFQPVEGVEGARGGARGHLRTLFCRSASAGHSVGGPRNPTFSIPQEHAMPLPYPEFWVRYFDVREELYDEFPYIRNDVEALVINLPAAIELQTFWDFGKDKPCWSNIRVEIGERIALDLNLHDDFRSYEAIAGEGWNIELIDRGPHWKRRDNFHLIGNTVIEFIDNLDNGGLRSYLWKLFAIRQLAIALSNDIGSARMQIERLIDNNLVFEPNKEIWTRRLASAIGMGWGPVTVQHMLTDLCLSIKADLHLIRSLVRMGALEPEISRHLPNNEIQAIPGIHNIAANYLDGAREYLATNPVIYDNVPTLREVDKVLMEWSRNGLARPWPEN